MHAASKTAQACRATSSVLATSVSYAQYVEYSLLSVHSSAAALLCRHMQLALLLLNEVKQSPASKFHPWIQTLPIIFDSLKYWSKAEMDELQTGTMPGEELKAQVRNICLGTFGKLVHAQLCRLQFQVHV